MTKDIPTHHNHLHSIKSTLLICSFIVLLETGHSFTIPSPCKIPSHTANVLKVKHRYETSSFHHNNNYHPYSSKLSMINNFFSSSSSTSSSSSSTLPKDVKQAVSKCRESVQKALQNRLSRMDIEFPVGTKFGIEPTSASSSGKNTRKRQLANAMMGSNSKSNEDDIAANLPSKDVLDKSDRELARLFVEMFQPVGGNAISVIFNTNDLADLAKSNWKSEASAQCNIMALNRNKKSTAYGVGGKSKSKIRKGFAAIQEVVDESSSSTSGPFKLPPNCEVAIFVSPGPKELVLVEKTCAEVGMGTLVILLNARLGTKFGSQEAKTLFTQDFERVFFLSSAPQKVAPGCLLHRAYPNDWVLARKPKVGAPVSIGTYKDRPTEEECESAYSSIEIGDLEKGVENVLDNVAGWFN